MAREHGSPIGQFYHGKTVFVTGATGFMGKVLVEKLLRSTTVAKIFVLIRAKKGVSSRRRLEQMLEARLFDKLREEDNEVRRRQKLSNLLQALRRVEVVTGDLTEEHLGISFEEER